MLLLGEPFNSKAAVGKHINDYGVELTNLLGYDIAKIIEFNENNSFATIKGKYVKDDIEYSSRFKDNRIFLKDSKNYILKVFLEKKQMVAYFKDDNNESDYISLIKDIQNEIYIPLFLDESISEVIIGCIYLGTFESKRFDKFEDIIDDKVREMIGKMNVLCQVMHVQTLWSERNFGLFHVINI